MIYDIQQRMMYEIIERFRIRNRNRSQKRSRAQMRYGEEFMNKQLLVRFTTCAALVLSGLYGCSSTPPIQKVSASTSEFDGAVFTGELIELDTDSTGAEKYRAYTRGATGFVSQDALCEYLGGQADRFCSQKDKRPKSLQERRAVPPFILGNFPRCELVFVCIEKPTTSTSEDTRYQRLGELKKLLDGGVITTSEFESEKAKILSEKR